MKNRLKVLRAERDWTQANLAYELGVTRQTVNAIEKKESSIQVYLWLSKLLGSLNHQ